MMQEKTLSVTAVKGIAALSMTIDHVGTILFPKLLWLRVLGRPAFVLYAALLVEGAAHTRSVPRYAARLAVCALLSEIPFDLAFGCGFDEQNVFFTLLIGLVMIDALSRAGSRIEEVAVFAAAALLATAVRADYQLFGIFLIFRLWQARRQGEDAARPVMEFALLYIGAGALSGLMAGDFPETFPLAAVEIACAAAIPIIRRMGEGRGKPRPCAAQRIAWYLYYPLHLAALAWIAR
jgi:hypothetical protein